MSATVFEAHRAELTRLAYRMTGSLAEAEDLVQEAWLRFEGQSVELPRAWLYRVVTRLCLDHLKSARHQREVYPGPWLPEPIVEADDPLELAEDLTLALLVALERLSPLERAAWLLHEVYDFGYDELGGLLGRSNTACRQLVSRSRTHLRQQRARFHPEPAAAQNLVSELVEAMMAGDLEGVMRHLREDVVLLSDGGGKAVAALRPVIGADKVARFFVGVAQKFAPSSQTRVWLTRVGGLPGLVASEAGQVVTTLAFDIEGDRVVAIYATRNPDKLARVPIPRSGGWGASAPKGLG
ncbi:MAG: sigma-70 family RNA polymerase sigma factor [Vulcanimicrobiota bacterium]